MTEQEILKQQETSGNTEFFMILIGRFLHAYGNGAFALARITGYHVRRQKRKAGEVLVLGFPIDRLEYVRDKIRDAGGDVESIDGKTWKFRGVDGTPDDGMVSNTIGTVLSVQFFLCTQRVGLPPIPLSIKNKLDLWAPPEKRLRLNNA